MSDLHNMRGTPLAFPLRRWEKLAIAGLVLYAWLAVSFGFAVLLYAIAPPPLRPVMFWWLEPVP
jgi:hypothetical protein